MDNAGHTLKFRDQMSLITFEALIQGINNNENTVVSPDFQLKCLPEVFVCGTNIFLGMTLIERSDVVRNMTLALDYLLQQTRDEFWNRLLGLFLIIAVNEHYHGTLGLGDVLKIIYHD